MLVNLRVAVYEGVYITNIASLLSRTFALVFIVWLLREVDQRVDAVADDSTPMTTMMMDEEETSVEPGSGDAGAISSQSIEEAAAISPKQHVARGIIHTMATAAAAVFWAIVLFAVVRHDCDPESQSSSSSSLWSNCIARRYPLFSSSPCPCAVFFARRPKAALECDWHGDCAEYEWCSSTNECIQGICDLDNGACVNNNDDVPAMCGCSSSFSVSGSCDAPPEWASCEPGRAIDADQVLLELQQHHSICSSCNRFCYIS